MVIKYLVSGEGAVMNFERVIGLWNLPEYSICCMFPFAQDSVQCETDLLSCLFFFVCVFPYFPREQYVDVYIDYYLNKSVEKQFQAFATGFHRVCGGKVLVSDYFALLNDKCLV